MNGLQRSPFVRGWEGGGREGERGGARREREGEGEGEVEGGGGSGEGGGRGGVKGERRVLFGKQPYQKIVSLSLHPEIKSEILILHVGGCQSL